MVQLLLAGGASFQVATRTLGSSDKYITALHVSCHTGNLEISRLLLDHFRPPIDIEDPYGRSPLSVAFEASNWETVEWLVQNGANVNAKIADGRSLLLSACAWGRLAEAYRLLQLGADLRPFHTTTPLHMCCQKSMDPSPQRKDDLQQGPLQQIDRLTLVKLLVDRGADVNVERLDNGHTPLMYAAYGGFLPVVQYLIDAGAHVNARDLNGETPLSKACLLGTALEDAPLLSIVKLLLGRGASATILDSFGRYPFELLCFSGRTHPDKTETARLLLAHGPPSGGMDSCASYLLDPFFKSNDFEICKLLQQLGARPRGDGIASMLKHAVRKDNVEALQYTLQFRDACELICSDTYLFAALQFKSIKVAEIILDAGAPWAYVSPSGWTCLLHACEIGNLHMVQKLLEAGAGEYYYPESACKGINHVDYFGKSPLRLAIEQGNHALGMVLLDFGADPLRAPTIEGLPCDLEIAIHFDEMVELVRCIIERGLVNLNSPLLPKIMWTVCHRGPGPATSALLEMFFRLGVDANMTLTDPMTSKLWLPLEILQECRNREGIDLLFKYSSDFS